MTILDDIKEAKQTIESSTGQTPKVIYLNKYHVLCLAEELSKMSGVKVKEITEYEGCKIIVSKEGEEIVFGFKANTGWMKLKPF